MAYITREDGEHFVIPSYREVITAKSKSALKSHILTLSQNYGDHITLRRKGTTQYEVAFSPDSGYLLGESIWHHFKRPGDMIYCEAIPNTTEALLVIVKNGSVYLDGSFPVESIPEELVIFLTQQNAFEIFVYGDVPISKTPEENKFSFEVDTVKSFTVLEQAVFQKLPLLKIYQLQLVDQVLKAHGIGVMPVKQITVAIVIIALIWLAWSYFSKTKEVVRQIVIPTFQADPYAEFYADLTTPAPDQEIGLILSKLNVFSTMPGWIVNSVEYSHSVITVNVTSFGSSIKALSYWATQHGATINIQPAGIFVEMRFSLPNRPHPAKIYNLQEVLTRFVDNIGLVYPGNNLKLDTIVKKQSYLTMKITITLTDTSPVILALIAEQIKDLPLTITKISFAVSNDGLSGTIILEALGR
ncbi:MAG: hypothetical protein A3F12_07270 [Gammaproteobacteria bacterium RIFCSPHIGHO2_12_FULL_38_14]|nr:MAG: hypothetical protein A3F12_07270 [Gammaproteobacteria bacterium RIFCSPHIGHO2_12_FULL_38_14]